MKKIFLLFIVFITAVLILFPTPSAAQFGKAIQKLDSAAGNTGLTKDLEGSVGNVISAVLSIVGTIFFALTVYAGIRWMTARGNEEEVTKAQEIIKAAVIGLVITMAAYAITAFVTGRLSSGGANNNSPFCLTAEGACVAGGGGACSGTPYNTLVQCQADPKFKPQ